MSDGDDVGLEERRREPSEDFLNRVLRVSVSRSFIIVARTSFRRERLSPVKRRIAETCEGVKYKYSVTSPFCGSTEIDVIVLPMVKHPDGVDECFWRAIYLGS